MVLSPEKHSVLSTSTVHGKGSGARKGRGDYQKTETTDYRAGKASIRKAGHGYETINLENGPWNG